MDVVHVITEIILVADKMFPIPPLPQAAFPFHDP